MRALRGCIFQQQHLKSFCHSPASLPFRRHALRASSFTSALQLKSRCPRNCRHAYTSNITCSAGPPSADNGAQGGREAPPKPAKVKIEGVQATALTKTVTAMRGICNERLKIDVEYGLKRGTTDNSYLIKDGNGYILIDVPDENFTDAYIDALKVRVGLKSISNLIITHLTPKRMPSLKAFLKERASLGQLSIHLSNPALQLLRSTLGKEEGGADILSSVDICTAKVGDSLEVGTQGLLQLVPSPTPRWPDLLVAYMPSERLLFTSKLFSAHVSPAKAGEPEGEATDKGGWERYSTDWRSFFECMLAPVARQAAAALEKLDVVAAPAPSQVAPLEAVLSALRATQKAIEDSQTSTFGAERMGFAGVGVGLVAAGICPMHGPVVKTSVAELVRKYREWIQAQIAASDKAQISVLYASAYGNTAALAQGISRGITKAGVGINTLNLEVMPLDEVSKAVSESSGFVIGSPTLGGHMPTQVQTALGSILRDPRAKEMACGVLGSFSCSGKAVDELEKRLKAQDDVAPMSTFGDCMQVQTALGAILRDPKAKEMPCGVFGSFGWSGEAVDELEKRLTDAGFQQAFEPIRVKFKPTAKDMQIAEESGTDLAQRVLKKLRLKEKQTSKGASKAEKATETEQAVGRILGALCAITAKDDDAESAMLASWISQASFDPPGLSVAVKKDRAAEQLLSPGAKFIVNIMAEGHERPLMKQLLKPFKPGEDRFEGLDIERSEVSGCAVLPNTAAYLECSVADRMEGGDHWIVYAIVTDGKVVMEGALSSVHHRKVGTTY